ncbi:MAG: patatin-like phospholipase RssA [Gammaproteobacteria bacterium]|nr:patatin-like phospholipase RssA [Gammaproteobacteria bacterium]MCW8910718.1 patatin-like phospholipase RssA [Gammaproteobacteria bacterium]MCW9005246.1 patatin-like phospholipase RssA [Gammaproteobacteria bacterium]MCW9055480.1 patatin-like phospholipase RssA [Gammaproteobacteria bacterium]
MKIDNSRIGIALGSGSARGWAHIGILQALSEMGIQPDIVAGSSIGALVGAAYSANQLDELESMVQTLGWKDIAGYLDVSIMGGGLIQGDKLTAFFHRHLKETRIEFLPHRFAAVATELNTGHEIWLQSGNLLDAVRASVALPGLFTPFKYNNQWLVDGGIVDPVPVSLCRAMGAEIVIAVSLNGNITGKQNHNQPETEARAKENETALWGRISDQLEKSWHEKKNILFSRLFGENIKSPGLIEVLAGSIHIMQDRITRSRMAGDPPDIILSPRLSQLGLMEYDRGTIAIEEGRTCVRRMQSALEQVISA